MDDTNANPSKPSSRTDTTQPPDPAKIREEAREKARSITPPGMVDSMAQEEIQQLFYEIQTKRLEAELENEHLRGRVENCKSQAEVLSTVTENMLDIVVLSDLEGNITFAGKAHETLGYNDGFLIGKNVTSFVHPEHLPYVLDELNKLLTSGGPRTVEHLFRCSDGSYMWLETLGRIVTDENNTPQKIVFSSRDITERKHMEDELRESEERYRLLVETSNDIVWVFNISTMSYIYCSKSVETILGYSQEEVKGFKLDDIFPQETQKRILARFDKVFKGETNSDRISTEAEHLHKDGSLVWMEISAVMQRDNMSKPVSFTGVSRDISERKQAAKAIENERAFLSAVIDNIGEAVVICDEKGQIARFNETARRLHGLPEKPIPSEQWAEFYDLYQEDGITPMPMEKIPLFRALQGERVSNAEMLVAPKNSCSYSLVCNGQALTDETGKITGAVVAMHDITERKQAEESLRESELRFRTVLENLPGAVFAHDLEGRLLFVNKTASVNSGYSEQELLAMTVPDIDMGHFTKDDRQQLWHSLNIGESKTIQSTHTRKNGSKYPVEIHLNAISLDNQPVILPIAIDITDRKNAEKEIAEQHSLIKAIYSNAPLIMMVVDGNRRLQQVNGFATRFAGRSAEEMIGLRGGEALRCLHALDDPRGCGFGEFCRECAIRNKVLETLEYGVANLQFEASFDFSSEDGTQSLALLVSTTPIPFQGEHMALVTIMDISERKQAEEEKEKLQAQLSQAQKMESVGRLAGGVAHDFNNMLSIINGYAEITLDMLDSNEPARKNIREIYNAGMRSADIVRQLLAFARQQTISPAKLDLNDTIPGMLKMLQRLIGENIELTWHPGNHLWPVKIDPSQVHQIMANLAVNARDAISDVGKLTIETKNVVCDEEYCKAYAYFKPGQYVMLAVSDDGCGMGKEVQENLFEPFFTTKETGKGSGLGLSTIYGIVKQNNGFINVYSEPGIGTTFKIYLPRHDTDAVPEMSTKPHTEHMPSGSETILLVEDEPPILRMARTTLEKLGYTVMTAASPKYALELAREHDGEIHLLITDVVMPEMNGRELALQLSAANPYLKTLYMSGYTTDVVSHHRVIDEDVLFMQKPFSIRDLAEKVREALK